MAPDALGEIRVMFLWDDPGLEKEPRREGNDG